MEKRMSKEHEMSILDARKERKFKELLPYINDYIKNNLTICHGKFNKVLELRLENEVITKIDLSE